MDHMHTIHVAAQAGDLRNVRGLLKDNPNLDFSKDNRCFFALVFHGSRATNHAPRLRDLKLKTYN
jgi:hypothetical protein